MNLYPKVERRPGLLFYFGWLSAIVNCNHRFKLVVVFKFLSNEATGARTPCNEQAESKKNKAATR